MAYPMAGQSAAWMVALWADNWEETKAGHWVVGLVDLMVVCSAAY